MFVGLFAKMLEKSICIFKCHNFDISFCFGVWLLYILFLYTKPVQGYAASYTGLSLQYFGDIILSCCTTKLFHIIQR